VCHSDEHSSKCQLNVCHSDEIYSSECHSDKCNFPDYYSAWSYLTVILLNVILLSGLLMFFLRSVNLLCYSGDFNYYVHHSSKCYSAFCQPTKRHSGDFNYSVLHSDRC
jgi:hypothetical protein